MVALESARRAVLEASLACAITLAAFWGVGWAIFLGPGLLARALGRLTPRRQICLSGLWGVFFAAVFYTWALQRDWPLWLCLLALKGLPWMAFPLPCLLWESRRPPHPMARALAFGLGLSAVAGFQLLDPVGFDWETPVAALAAWPWCLTLLPWTGLVGMAGVIGFISCLLWQGRRHALWGLLALLVWIGLSLALTPSPSSPDLPRVALIQTGWNEWDKWDPANREKALRRLIDLSRRAREQGAELIIWPETAWPARNLRHDPNERRQVSQLASSLGTDLLVSSLEQPGASWTNSATLVSRTGRFALEYQKRRLIPLQEYLPLPAPWEAFFRQRGWVRPSCHYKAGERSVVFESEGRKLAVLICFESVVPGPAAGLAEEVDFLVVQANDAGLRSDFARECHFRSAILRAAQARKPVLQVANDGVTGFIDGRGAVLLRSAPGSTSAQVIMLPMGEK